MQFFAILSLVESIVAAEPAAFKVIQDILTDIQHFKAGKLTEADVNVTVNDGLAILKALMKTQTK